MMELPSALPVYTDSLTRQTGALQQLQRIMDDRQSCVTLNDVAALVQGMQERYGVEATLEGVIQDLVGMHLSLQVEARQRRKELVS